MDCHDCGIGFAWRFASRSLSPPFGEVTCCHLPRAPGPIAPSYVKYLDIEPSCDGRSDATAMTTFTRLTVASFPRWRSDTSVRPRALLIGAAHYNQAVRRFSFRRVCCLSEVCPLARLYGLDANDAHAASAVLPLILKNEAEIRHDRTETEYQSDMIWPENGDRTGMLTQSGENRINLLDIM